jgi:hypothetical protein
MDDVIQYQRLASGYVPGQSESNSPVAVPPSSQPNFGLPAPSTADLQNCIVTRIGVGIYDILVGGNNPAPVGIGGVFSSSPPLFTPPVAGAIVVGQARVSINVRSPLTAQGVAPPTTAAGNPNVTWAVWMGAQLGPAPLYSGFANTQVFRVIMTTTVAGVLTLADVDFDFQVEQVIDPGTGP